MEQKNNQDGAQSESQIRSSAVLAVLPPLAGELKTIMGTLHLSTARIGRRLHELKIYDVPRQIEEEHAAALHWMLNLYFAHGEKWREEGAKILKGESTANAESSDLRAKPKS